MGRAPRYEGPPIEFVKMSLFIRSILVSVCLLAGVSRAARSAYAQSNNGPLLPVAVAWSVPGHVVVAARDARALLEVDVTRGAIAARHELAFRPASLAPDRENGWWVGGQTGELARLHADGTVAWQTQIGRGRVSLALLPEGTIAASAVWDRRVRILDTRSHAELASADLPFEVGALAALPDGRLAAADAFRNRMATFRAGAPQAIQVWEVDGVSPRGLQVSHDGVELLYVAMVTNSPAHLTRTNLDWGLVISSKLAALRLDTALRESVGAASNRTSARAQARLLTLDGSGHGAADPTALASANNGRDLYIALAGANQVLHVDRSLGGPMASDHRPLGNTQQIRALNVGARPVSMAIEPAGERLVVVSASSDELTLIRTHPFAVDRVIMLSENTQPSAQQRGEAAFHDARLAMDRWMSCASCHIDAHTSGLNYDTLGDGSYGFPKNTVSLLGAANTAPFAWLGRFETLEEQIEHSLRTSLHGRDTPIETIGDLAAYLTSLPSPPPLRGADDAEAKRGAAVFTERGCARCHAPPSYTSRAPRNVGLDTRGVEYNPPSLSGVGRSAPYFHDGRAAGLEDALKMHHPGFEEPPDPRLIAELVAFLESL